MQRNKLEIQVSVVIPSFNAANTLPTTLLSVMPELGPLDEVVVVDDGSTDNTAAAVLAFGDGRVKYVHQSNSGGPASPRNKGIAEALGELIFLFDSDDLMLPGKIEAAKAAYCAHPDAGLIFSNFKTIDDEGETLTPFFLDDYELTAPFARTEEIVRFDYPKAYRALAKENYIGTSGVVVPKSVFKSIGTFDHTLRNGDDRDMWFRITKRYPIIYIPQVFHAYRIGHNSISKGSAHKRIPSKLKVLERQLAEPLDKSFENDVLELIADNYHALAYESFTLGRMADCRRESLKGWSASKRNAFIKFWVLSFLGDKITSGLRKLRKTIFKSK